MNALAIALAVAGGAWGLVADRIAARWPEHEAEVSDAGDVEATASGLAPVPAPVTGSAPAAAATPADRHPAGWIRPIDWRTPVVAATGALALAGVALRFGDDPGQLAVFGAWAIVLVLLLATDLDQRLLPDALTLPLAVAAVLVVLAGLDPFVAPADLPQAALVAVAVAVGLYVVSIPFGAGAFGLGDVKFLVGFGLLAGPDRFLVGLISGILLAGVVIVVLLAARRVSLRAYVPYGPFLVLGALWALLGPR
jgi:leader peptidase (prepilin peptidase)/N-methyltransferase